MAVLSPAQGDCSHHAFLKSALPDLLKAGISEPQHVWDQVCTCMTCCLHPACYRPAPLFRHSQNVAGTTRQTDYSALPFPVVTCTFEPGLPDVPESFQDSSSLDSPPCIRPSVGRDDVAYTSFILQNWDHLPPHLFFMHGHETSWHQDSDSTQIIREFCDRNLSQSMFVSLTNNIGRDWRRIFCVAGQCSSARKQRELEKAWHKYLGYYLGPLPPDFTHFCCSQFAVSRSRVLLRARQLYLNILTFSLMEYPGIYEAMPCYGKCELPGAVMEVLWPYVFGAGVPLGYDERLQLEWPTDEYLPRQLMRAYRYAWSTDDWLREPLAFG